MPETSLAPAPAPAGDAVRLDGLSVTLGDARILRDVSLSLRAHELTGVIGPNGAGKSTLLRAITGFVPAAGRVALRGGPLQQLSPRDVAREIAVVQQLPEAPPGMRVADLVMLGRHPHIGLLGRESRRDHDVVARALADAGCDDLAGRTLATLSGGERRRAFIARALAQEPATLLLDEPTASLDVEAQGEIFELLRSLVAAGVAVCAVVHDLTLAAAYCDRLILLHHGEVVDDGPPAAVLTEAQVRAVYGPHVSVLTHPHTGRPLVVPSGPNGSTP